MSVSLSQKIQEGRYRGINGANFSWAALAVGAGTAIAGAATGYLSSSQQSNAANGLANAGYQTPDYSGVIDYLGSNWQQPQYQNYTPTSYSEGFDQFLGQRKYMPQIKKFLRKTDKQQNKQFQNTLSRTSPTLMGNIQQLGTNTASQLRGEVPADVAQQIQRNTAEQSIFGGYGGSGMARNLTSRDLGLTSLDMMQRGNQGLALQNNITQSVNPYHTNALDYLMSPQQLFQTQIGQNQFGTNVFNTNQTNSSQIANQRAAMIAQLMQSQQDVSATGQNTQNQLNYQAAMAPNPWASALSSGAGALASSYGGGSFGGGSPSYGGTYGGYM